MITSDYSYLFHIYHFKLHADFNGFSASKIPRLAKNNENFSILSRSPKSQDLGGKLHGLETGELKIK